MGQNHGILTNSDKQFMGKHVVKWTPVVTRNVRNQNCDARFPELLDRYSRWTLLGRIAEMEKKEPITFKSAVELAQSKFIDALFKHRIGRAPGECFWYAVHFVDWIASLGFHIELTGEEFESYPRKSPRT